MSWGGGGLRGRSEGMGVCDGVGEGVSWLEWKKCLDFLDLLSFGHLFRDCFRGFIFT